MLVILVGWRGILLSGRFAAVGRSTNFEEGGRGTGDYGKKNCPAPTAPRNIN